MLTDLNILSSLIFFKDLAVVEKELLARKFESREVKAGDTLLEKDLPAHTFFVVVSGEYEIRFITGRFFRINTPGEVMGWSTMVTPFRSTGTITVLKGGQVLYISRRKLLDIIQGNAALGEKLMKKIQAVVQQRLPYIQDDKGGSIDRIRSDQSL